MGKAAGRFEVPDDIDACNREVAALFEAEIPRQPSADANQTNNVDLPSSVVRDILAADQDQPLGEHRFG